MKQKDKSRYYEEDVRGSIGVAFSEKQFERALTDFGYDEFPDNGITDKGHTLLMNRLSEIDRLESNLRLVKRKDLGSNILEAPVKINKEKSQKSGSWEKWVGKIITYPTLGNSIAIPTMIRKAHEFGILVEGKSYAMYPIIGCVISNVMIYNKLSKYFPELILPIALTQLTTNAIDGTYEYLKSLRKRGKGNIITE
jgi:hypothetical protein